jgi:dipeptidyl aminopeptidase/acylaminoacyl peptidase
MTAWITTKTNRFKAAEADRMISEWTYWYGASDAQGLTEFEFYGKPWDKLRHVRLAVAHPSRERRSARPR